MMKKLLLPVLLLICSVGISFGQTPNNIGFGGVGNDGVYSSASDSEGNLYFVGTFESTVDFDATTNAVNVSSNGLTDCYIIKYNTNNELVWVRTFGGTDEDILTGIVYDSLMNNLLISGSFKGTSNFDPNGSVTKTSNGDFDHFVSRIDTAGNLIWNKTYGGASPLYEIAITCDINSAVYITGNFNGTVDFNPDISLTDIKSSVSASGDIYLLKLNSDGDYEWCHSFGSSVSDAGRDIVTDNDGNVYATGFFNGTIDFDASVGGDSILTSSGNDAFIIKYDGNGNFTWARNYAAIGQGLAISSDNFIYATGKTGTNDLDPGTGVINYTTNGLNDMYISKFNLNGEVEWSKGFGSSNNDFPASNISFSNNSQKIYFMGSYEGIMLFDSNTKQIESNGLIDGYLINVDSQGEFLWGSTIGGINDDYLYGVHCDSLNTISFFGNANSDIYPQYSLVVDTVENIGSRDCFIGFSFPNTPPCLVAQYDFNGNANDLSGWGNHGTVNGPSLTCDRFGHADSAYYFDGVDDSISVASNSINISTDATWSMWLYWNGDNIYTGNQAILDKSDNSDLPNYRFGVYNSNGASPYKFFFVSGSNSIVSTTNMPINKWVQLSATYTGGTVRLFLDGVETDNGAIAINDPGITPINIGNDGHPTADRFFNGKIDDVIVMNCALSAAQIDSIYQAEKSPLDPCLVAKYDFNGNADDLSGNCNHGTVVGATLTTDRYGNANSAMLFNGNSDYIDIGNASSLDRFQTDFSISTWIRTPNLTTQVSQTILSNRNSGIGGTKLGIVSTLTTGQEGNLILSTDGVSDAVFSSDSIWNNKWTKIDVTYQYNGGNNNVVNFYIDGQLKNSIDNVLNDVLDPSGINTYIGYEPYGPIGADYFFEGEIDGLNIYNCVLSPTDIDSLWKSECVPFESTQNIKICDGDSYLAEGALQTTPGLYYDTLQAVNGCDSIVTTNLTINTAIVVTSTITDDNGNSTGAVDASITGGSTPYSYSWSNAAVTEDVTTLSAGTYVISVTDSLGCMATHSATVNNTCNISLAMSETGSTCGLENGTASVVASGGTSPYTYEWSYGPTTTSIDSLQAGLYFVTVTDDNGCIEYGTATVNDSPGATIGTAATPASCFGGADGAIDATISVGTTPYTYEWSNGALTEDVTGLVAGQYQLQVTDADGCIANDNITITTATALVITTAVTNASCGGNADGAITSTVTGGTGAYTYLWSTTATTADVNGLIAGVYMLTVTDANGCMDSTSVSVNEENGAVVHLDSVVSASCGGLGSAYVSAYGNAPFTYAWSNSDVTQDLVDVMPGTYQLEVTAASGCVSNLSVLIGNDMPGVQDICIVTVDSATNTNTVVWEKPITTAIESFNVYKESTVANQYFLAGNVPYDSLSQFNDPNSNPSQRAWRYRLTAVDTCGTESEMGTIHKTIHLTVSLGQGNDYNLAWNHYEGFTYGSYYISRYKPSTGWVDIDTLPSNLNTYTDFSQPQGNVYYAIEAVHPNGCTSTKAQDHNTTRSNRATIMNGGSLDIITLDEETNFMLYPNPAKDYFMVKCSNTNEYHIELYNISGELVTMLNNQHDEVEMDVSSLSNGIYLLKITSNGNTIQKKIVVSK